MSYQGWTNYETWAVNQRFGEIFSMLGSESEITVSDLREAVQQTFVLSKVSGLEAEFITMSMARVDWEELVEAYQFESFLIDEF
jgi:hypothetical protein